MKINRLRRELAGILEKIPSKRTPALRRSIPDDWLYATDLPVIPGNEPEGALAVFTEAGWDCRIDGAWLLLRKSLKEPPDDWFEGPFGPEAGCCLSILRRHRERMNGNTGDLAFALIKAGEEGADAYEQTCGKLHGLFSALLRQGKELPDISLRYFGEE